MLGIGLQMSKKDMKAGIVTSLVIYVYFYLLTIKMHEILYRKLVNNFVLAAQESSNLVLNTQISYFIDKNK